MLALRLEKQVYDWRIVSFTSSLGEGGRRKQISNSLSSLIDFSVVTFEQVSVWN